MVLVLAETRAKIVETNLPRNKAQWKPRIGLAFIHGSTTTMSCFLGDSSNTHFWSRWPNITMESRLGTWYIETWTAGTLLTHRRYHHKPQGGKAVNKTMLPTSPHGHDKTGATNTERISQKSCNTRKYATKTRSNGNGRKQVFTLLKAHTRPLKTNHTVRPTPNVYGSYKYHRG